MDQVRARAKKLSKPGLWLFPIIVVAAFFRIINIGRDSLWFDEAVSYLAANLPPAQILDNTVQSSHPPLYYLLLHYWLAIGPGSDEFARLLGLLWSLLTIPAIYLLAIELFNSRKIGLAAALLIAVSPFHVMFSQELRMYTQLMFLVVVMAYATVRAINTGTLLWRVLAVLTTTAGVLTHVFAWFVYVGIGLYTLIYHRERKNIVFLLLIGGIALLLFMPWAIGVLKEAQSELGSLRPLSQAASVNVFKPLSGLTFAIFGMSGGYAQAGIALFMFLAIFIVTALELRKVWHQVRRSVMLPLLAVVFAALLPLVFYIIRPFFLPERSLAAASPFLILMVVWGITRRSSPLPYLTAAASLFMVISTIVYLAGGLVKPPYREAIEYVEANSHAGDLIVHTSDGSYLPGLRYAPELQQVLLAGDPDPRKPAVVYTALGGEVRPINEILQYPDRLWAIVALEHSVDWQTEQVTFLAGSFQLRNERDFGGIALRLYERP